MGELKQRDLGLHTSEEDGRRGGVDRHESGTMGASKPWMTRRSNTLRGWQERKSRGLEKDAFEGEESSNVNKQKDGEQFERGKIVVVVVGGASGE